MPRLIPFAVALFMLAPFAVWGALWLSGMRGSYGFDHPEQLAMLAASLPLAGLFWIRNLREIADALGEPSRLRTADRLSAALPVAVAAVGVAGVAALVWLGRPAEAVALVGVAAAAMAGFAALAARSGRAVHAPPAADAAAPVRRGDDVHVALRYGALNAVMLLAVLSMALTPAVLFWAALLLVPVAFAAMLGLAAWATRAA
jgi:hypothetical protein